MWKVGANENQIRLGEGFHQVTDNAFSEDVLREVQFVFRMIVIIIVALFNTVHADSRVGTPIGVTGGGD